MKRGLKQRGLYHVGTNPTFKAFILIYQKEKQNKQKKNKLLNQGSFPAFVSNGSLLKVFLNSLAYSL